MSPAASTSVPNMKSVSKKTLEPARVLSKPVGEKDFRQQFPECKVSLSKFHQLRPLHVKTTHRQTLFQCLCGYCSNAKGMVQSVNRACDKYGVDCKLQDINELVRVTVCAKGEGETYFPIDCLQRKCNNCGLAGLDIYTEPLQEAMQNDEMSWKVWKTENIPREGKPPTKQKVLKT